MKLLRHILTIVWTVAAVVSSADQRLPANAKCVAKPPTAGELLLLQGTWEGVQVGEESPKRITITITGNSLHFHRDTNFWFETTFTLPALAYPHQLHATIKNSAPPTNSVGQVVRAIFKIEDGTLTLATGGEGEEGIPKSFESTEDKGITRYELRRTQPQKKNRPPAEAQ